MIEYLLHILAETRIVRLKYFYISISFYALTDLIVSIYGYPGSLDQFTLKFTSNLHRHTVDDLNGMGVVTYVSRGADDMVSYLSLTLCVCVTLVLCGSYNLRT